MFELRLEFEIWPEQEGMDGHMFWIDTLMLLLGLNALDLLCYSQCLQIGSKSMGIARIESNTHFRQLNPTRQ